LSNLIHGTQKDDDKDAKGGYTEMSSMLWNGEDIGGFRKGPPKL